MAERPSPFELWQRASGDGPTYIQLLREHGHVIDREPGDTTPLFACGYDPHRQAQPAMAEHCPWRLRAGALDVGCQLTHPAHFEDPAEAAEHYHRSAEGWGVEWTSRTDGAYRAGDVAGDG